MGISEGLIINKESTIKTLFLYGMLDFVCMSHQRDSWHRETSAGCSSPLASLTHVPSHTHSPRFQQTRGLSNTAFSSPTSPPLMSQPRIPRTTAHSHSTIPTPRSPTVLAAARTPPSVCLSRDLSFCSAGSDSRASLPSHRILSPALVL